MKNPMHEPNISYRKIPLLFFFGLQRDTNIDATSAVRAPPMKGRNTAS